MRRRKQILAILAILGVLLSSSCGGGGTSSSSPSPAPTPTPTPTPIPQTILSWEPPIYFTNDSPLAAVTDLQGFEIYVRQDTFFAPGDSAVQTVSPNATMFDLATLVPSLSRGVTYYASVRAVPVDGEKSDFSDIRSFTFPQ